VTLIEARMFADYLQDSARACYGPKHVEIAHDRLAVQTLLITDTLFR
jgi:protein pelota